MVNQSGTIAWSRRCPIDANTGITFQASSCTAPWTSTSLTNIRGVGNESYSGYSQYVTPLQRSTTSPTGSPKLVQSLISRDGKKSWGRNCPINSTSGVAWNSCTSWVEYDLTSLIPANVPNGGGTNQTFGAYSDYIYIEGGVDRFRQSIISLNGAHGWTHSCKVNVSNGSGYDCLPWEYVPKADVGLYFNYVGYDCFIFTANAPLEYKS